MEHLSIQLENGYKMCYWDNGNTNAKKVLISFSGGFEYGAELIPVKAAFPDDFRLLSPCVPGRGNTPVDPKFDSFEELARLTALWLKAMHLEGKEIYLWGTSFGTALVTELMAVTPYPVSGVILLTPGEFIRGKFVSFGFEKIMRLTYTNRALRAMAKKFLTHIYPFNNKRFRSINAKSLNEQALATCTYRINTGRQYAIPTLIINCKPEVFIEPESLLKIYKVFPNHSITCLEHGHVIDPEKEKEYFVALLQNHINPFLVKLDRGNK